MRVAELSLRNYRVFEQVDLELPARVIGIFGSNGSGKSTLVESILFALYGRARTSKNEIRTQGLLTDCEVRLVFEHGGRAYEVRRSIKGKNSVTDAELFTGDLQLAVGVTEVDTEIAKLLRMDQQVFRASVFAEQKQLDAFSDVTKGKRKEMVLRLLGVRPVDDALAQARKAAREVSGDAERLAAAAADMSELETVLKEWKAASKASAVRARAVAAKAKQAEKAAKVGAEAFEKADEVRERVEKVALQLRAASDERKGITSRVGELSARVKALHEGLDELPIIKKELSGLAGVSDRLRLADKLAEQVAAAGKIEKQLAAMAQVNPAQALERLAQAEAEALNAANALAAAKANAAGESTALAQAAERMDRASGADPSERCPTCGRELGGDFAAYMRHCKQELAAAKKASTAANGASRTAEAASTKAVAALAKARRQGEGVQDSVQRRGHMTEQLEEVRARVAELTSEFPRGEIPDVKALRTDSARERQLGERLAQLDVEASRLKESESDLEKAATRAGVLDSSIDGLEKEAAGLAFDSKEHGRLRAERDAAAAVRERSLAAQREADGDENEAKVHLGRIEGQIEQARETAQQVESLRGEARYLERVKMLLDGFKSHLTARIGPELSREAEALFRELTNHEYDDLKIDDDTLGIEIADGEVYFSTDRFSGSEVDLANLALRVAISMHLSRMSGADVGMMVLDEVLGSLDAERKDLMVHALTGLSGRFHQLFVITHAEQIKDQFPASIEIRKTGRRRSEAVLI